MEYKYKAFISYRHLEPDMQAAERLQKLLESYRPPRNLGLSKEKWRIFRDVSELQSSSDLSEDIRNAIESSEFLIVICSPRYTESGWCMQELTRFRELHNNSNQNIITLLVSGEPRESFPEQLTYTEVTTTNDKGEEVKVRMEVEPLAANIKADTLKASMKKLDTEYLRIAAPLLGCDFNDLFQREKRREAARRRRIFGGISAILSLITVISVASALTISRKNVQIQEQNNQIIEQNEQIEKKNSELLIENAGHLAVESENLYKESSLIPAIQKAVEALPAEGEEKPILPEAEYALSRELGMFRHSQLVPQLALRHDCAIEQLSFMGGGKTIVTQDATGVYFWDPETGSLIKKVSASDSEFAASSGDTSGKLTAVFDVSPDKTGTYFASTSAPGSITYENSSVFNKIYTNYVHSVDDDEPGTGGDVYLYNADCTIWRLDGATGEIKWKSPSSEDVSSYYKVVFDGQDILRIYQQQNATLSGIALPGDSVFLEIIDRETGKVRDCVDITPDADAVFGFLMDYSVQAVQDGMVYLYSENTNTMQACEIADHAVTQTNEMPLESAGAGIHSVTMQFIGEDPLITSCSVMAFNTSTAFTRCDKDLTEQKWSAQLPVNYQNGGKVFLIPAADSELEHDVLAVMTKLSLSFIDYETGEIIKNIPLDSEVIDASYSRYGLVMFTVSDGTEYTVSLYDFTSGNDADNAAYRVQSMNTAVSLCSYSRGKYVTSANYSNTVYIQYVAENPMYTDIDPGEYMYSREVLTVEDSGGCAAVSAIFYPDGKYADSAALTKHLFLYDTGGECREVTDLKDYKIFSAAFAGKDTLVVNACPENPDGTYSADEIFCIDTASGKASKVSGAPSAKRPNVKLIPTDSGVYYLNDAERNLTRIAPDGSVQNWAQANAETGKPDQELLGAMYAVSGSKAALYAQLGGEEDTAALLIHDFESGQEVTLNCTLSAGTAVQQIFWQNSDTVGVFFSDRTVSLFDAASGELTATVSLVGTSQEPISVAAVSDDTFAVLCRDSCLYEMRTDGFTGRSCRLDFSSEKENTIRESDSSSAQLLTVQPSADGTRRFVVWDSAQAWLLDTDRFTMRYRIDSFAAAPSGSSIVFIKDTGRNKIGFFPLYSTQQLLEAAGNYLAALGES